MNAAERAFTLVELLMVMAIMAVAMGLVGVAMTRTNAEASVKGAADALASVLRQARTMALVNKAPHGVVFNIQNSPGSSGKVLNNRSGGHWYRIIGPAKSTIGGSSRQILIPYQWSENSKFNWTGQAFATFPQFVEGIRDDWIGRSYSLPAGKVRILALGETDEGNRINGGNQDDGYSNERGYGYTSTYPRPWFGYFDPVRKRLFPWGGYDPSLHSEPWDRIQGSSDPVTNYTGFFYQGRDGAIPDSRNPADRIFQVDWNLDKDFNDADPLRGPEAAYYVYRKDEPRALVNADWLDWMIMFLPNGDAYVPPFGVARKRYSDKQVLANPTNENEAQGDGVSDRAKPWAGTRMNPGSYFTGNGFGYSENMGNFMPNYEIGDFSRTIHGWHVTLAADSTDDRDSFDSATEALKAIGPMYRIFIGRRGAVEVYRVRTVGDDWLSGKPFFPSSPEFFQCRTSGGVYGDDARRMGKTFRYGWLHLDRTSTGANLQSDHYSWELVPTGRPISREVCPRMMQDKIWWIQ